MDFRQLLFSFRGRIGRGALLAITLVNLVLVSVLVGGTLGIMPTTFLRMETSLGVVLIVVVAAWTLAAWVGLASTVKRLHDLDHTGHHCWWIYGQGVVVGASNEPMLSLLSLVVGFGVLAYLIFMPGTPGPNRFGPSRTTAQTVTSGE
jgi:uncharacterized membrane protein YhaH (DUF805 family)